VTAAIEISDLTVSYDGAPVLRGVSGRFPAGVLSAVVGPNGSGKTTLLKSIAGQLRPSSGRVRFAGPGRAEFAYLPQRPAFDRTFPIAVRDVVAMGLWPRLGPFRRPTAAMRDGVERAIAAVGLTAWADRRIGALSGGQLQRALFARLIAQNAPVVLLDEPFTNVDAHTIGDLMALMGRWRDEGRIVVAVLHDLDLAHRDFGWTMLLAHQSVACGPTPEVLTSANLAQARALCDACAADRHFWASA